MQSNSIPQYKKLPIWRDANRLLIEIERSVRKFPRYHKYTLGSELRRMTMDICRCVARAAHYSSGSEAQREQERLLERMVFIVEDLKITIQVAQELEAFSNFAEFARIAELAVAVGKQCGGWRKAARARVRTGSSEVGTAASGAG